MYTDDCFTNSSRSRSQTSCYSDVNSNIDGSTGAILHSQQSGKGACRLRHNSPFFNPYGWTPFINRVPVHTNRQPLPAPLTVSNPWNGATELVKNRFIPMMDVNNGMFIGTSSKMNNNNNNIYSGKCDKNNPSMYTNQEVFENNIIHDNAAEGIDYYNNNNNNKRTPYLVRWWDYVVNEMIWVHSPKENDLIDENVNENNINSKTSGITNNVEINTNISASVSEQPNLEHLSDKMEERPHNVINGITGVTSSNNNTCNNNKNGKVTKNYYDYATSLILSSNNENDLNNIEQLELMERPEEKERKRDEEKKRENNVEWSMIQSEVYNPDISTADINNAKNYDWYKEDVSYEKKLNRKQKKGIKNIESKRKNKCKESKSWNSRTDIASIIALNMPSRKHSSIADYKKSSVVYGSQSNINNFSVRSNSNSNTDNNNKQKYSHNNVDVDDDKSEYDNNESKCNNNKSISSSQESSSDGSSEEDSSSDNSDNESNSDNNTVDTDSNVDDSSSEDSCSVSSMFSSDKDDDDDSNNDNNNNNNVEITFTFANLIISTKDGNKESKTGSEEEGLQSRKRGSDARFYKSSIVCTSEDQKRLFSPFANEHEISNREANKQFTEEEIKKFDTKNNDKYNQNNRMIYTTEQTAENACNILSNGNEHSYLENIQIEAKKRNSASTATVTTRPSFFEVNRYLEHSTTPRSSLFNRETYERHNGEYDCVEELSISSDETENKSNENNKEEYVSLTLQKQQIKNKYKNENKSVINVSDKEIRKDEEDMLCSSTSLTTKTTAVNETKEILHSKVMNKSNTEQKHSLTNITVKLPLLKDRNVCKTTEENESKHIRENNNRVSNIKSKIENVNTKNKLPECTSNSERKKESSNLITGKVKDKKKCIYENQHKKESKYKQEEEYHLSKKEFIDSSIVEDNTNKNYAKKSDNISNNSSSHIETNTINSNDRIESLNMPKKMLLKSSKSYELSYVNNNDNNSNNSSNIIISNNHDNGTSINKKQYRTNTDLHQQIELSEQNKNNCKQENSCVNSKFNLSETNKPNVLEKNVVASNKRNTNHQIRTEPQLSRLSAIEVVNSKKHATSNEVKKSTKKTGVNKIISHNIDNNNNINSSDREEPEELMQTKEKENVDAAQAEKDKENEVFSYICDSNSLQSKCAHYNVTVGTFVSEPKLSHTKKL